MIIYLKPRSLFPTLHSDTIFGALIYTIKEIYPEIFQELLEKFKKGNPPFLVSSAYPYIQEDDEKIKFFPKPLLEPGKFDDMESSKKIRKYRYIEESIFNSWINKGEKEIGQRMDDYLLRDGLLYNKNLKSDFNFFTETVPRNTINRITNASENIFYSSGVAMKGLGLFFMVRFLESGYENILEGCMRFLKDRGFGGDISTGRGHFDYDITDENLLSDEGERFITLSRYIPQVEELKSIGDDLWYELGSKRGRSSTGTLRREIRFFREGSSFKSLGKSVYGCLVDSEEDSVEYGMAYPVGIGGKEK